MQLGDLLDDLSLDVTTGRIEIDSVQIDSRECTPGALFFAMPGHGRNGAYFAGDAVARGAVAVVAAEHLDIGVPVVTVPSSQLRALLAEASAAIVGHPETRTELVGVTGTNGKTSVTTMVAQLAQALDWNGASIGTLTNERTTPAPPELFRTLASIVDGFDHGRRRAVVALEVSSHALDQGRVDGLRFAAAGFTNLSHDHLDYHTTMEEYFSAKERLFSRERCQRAVVWVDDPYGARLAEQINVALTVVRRSDASDVESSLAGTTFVWRGLPVSTSLVGGYNVDNSLMAMTIMSVLGAHDVQIVAAMAAVTGVPGRFQVIRSHGVVVIVDYAHTPEGLRRLLADVRAASGDARVLTVFGCGGDRDRAKRPEMGEVASNYSDVSFVTSDNPRSEEPDAIIDAIMSGVVAGAQVRRIVERREAIAEALRSARRGDVVVIAGKGHEVTQTIGDLVVPFDDRVVAQELLENMQC
ncbi:MAG TPA: UDP-N-acetylmuramoyl-L-alanyl-D-glutamate--2,6-diaminopimelate ligase [Acidimicrobiales bacterium]|nr:UDP-N-acetylmuramoyl-L-alanyl-D-glutamate--2,6-diaminopimelate ligase [Acidimicrobiales bacterium]